MTQLFGRRLIENLIGGRDVKLATSNPVELQLVVDSSGAYLPGHGTPTVIIIGRRQWASGQPVTTVLGVKGEPGIPKNPSQGYVWTEIAQNYHVVGFKGEYIEVVSRPYESFASHPWSLSADAAGDAKARMELAGRRLKDFSATFGYTGQTNADGAFLAPASAFVRNRIEPSLIRAYVTGDDVRDYHIRPELDAIFPYVDGELVDISDYPHANKWFWRVRQATWARRTFKKMSYREEGRTWWEWHQVSHDRVGRTSLTYASIASHLHFAVDREGKLFNRHAAFLQFPHGSDAVDFAGMLALLNSSAACFWMKQVSHHKGGDQLEPWRWRYEYNGTQLKDLPVPSALPTTRGECLEALVEVVDGTGPSALVTKVPNEEHRASAAQARWDAALRRMIFEQEELDWEVYRLYGLVDEDLTYDGTWPEDERQLNLGERAFEVVLARAVRDGTEKTAWFERHGSTAITELPEYWPSDYKALVERRLA